MEGYRISLRRETDDKEITCDESDIELEFLKSNMASKQNGNHSNHEISLNGKINSKVATVPTPAEGWKEIIQQYLKDNYRLEHELQDLKEIYFHSLAVQTKMNLSAMGQPSNVDIRTLFESVQAEKVPFSRWSSWISQRLQKKL